MLSPSSWDQKIYTVNQNSADSQASNGAMHSAGPMLSVSLAMGLLPDTQNYRLRIPQECRERFPATAG